MYVYTSEELFKENNGDLVSYVKIDIGEAISYIEDVGGILAEINCVAGMSCVYWSEDDDKSNRYCCCNWG